MQDHGCSLEEAGEEAQEAGNIRNVNPQLRWFYHTDSTEYYMPNAILSVKPIKVDYETFRDRMIPAIENGETWLTFVKAAVSGETIEKSNGSIVLESRDDE